MGGDVCTVCGGQGRTRSAYLGFNDSSRLGQLRHKSTGGDQAGVDSDRSALVLLGFSGEVKEEKVQAGGRQGEPSRLQGHRSPGAL